MYQIDRMLSPAAVFAALGGVPAVWADAGRRRTVIAPLHAGRPVEAVEWRGLAREALGAPPGLPFTNGRVGWFGYEAGAWMEPQQPPPVAEPWLPRCWMGEVRAAACLDTHTGVWEVSGDGARALWERLRAAPEVPPVGVAQGCVTPDFGAREAYIAGVEQILRHVRAGDCYQVNLAREVCVTDVGAAVDVWRRLRATNPARRAVFLDTPVGAVVSNSPELLLRAGGGVPGRPERRVRSVPIKGTAPRAGGVPAAVRLLHSAKERAELTMIVDLVRADLGWVARPGSVIAGRRRVGGVGHVWHALQAVEAALAEGKDAVDAFTALFPAGSVTGAPRIRAMEVIRALEPTPRGVYCGAVGWFGGGGEAWWNVAIRTVSVKEGNARFHVGAGIVIGSDPVREWEETELKAERMLGALVRPLE